MRLLDSLCSILMIGVIVLYAGYYSGFTYGNVDSIAGILPADILQGQHNAQGHEIHVRDNGKSHVQGSPGPNVSPATTEERGRAVSRMERPADYRFEVTAYTWTGYKTALGEWPRVGIVATDPRAIPMGSRLYIEGYGEAVAGDTGGDIKGDRIDVYFNTRKEALEWGRRFNVRVWILEGDFSE